jgi:phosphatidylinositol-3-phosphatase
MKKSLVPALAALVGALALAVAGCASSAPSGGAPASQSPAPTASVAPTASAAPAASVPEPAHTVVVVLENHGYGQVIGSSDAPYLNQLASRGALFTQSYAITHPSEPNYLALFSGSTQGVTSDACPVTFTAPNLAAGLIAAGKTFTGYAEGLPAPGSTVCSAGEYARKHVPWTDFGNVPAAVNRPFSRFPANDFASLPTVSFVIPNLCHDMHDCSVATGDSWLRAHLGGYATWATTHDSLLIVTFDEDDGGGSNKITTIFLGQNVRPGRYPERITHYSVLATLEAAYGLTRHGGAASTPPISDIWQS